MSGFGKFSTIRYRFRRAILDSSCVTFNPRPLLFCDFRKDSRWCREIKLVHRWSGLHRRILETVPLLGITEREKMVLESVSGIAAQLHRFTVFTLSILLASLIHRYPPRLPSISIFPLRKSIIETWEISKLYLFHIPVTRGQIYFQAA